LVKTLYCRKGKVADMAAKAKKFGYLKLSAKDGRRYELELIIADECLRAAERSPRGGIRERQRPCKNKPRFQNTPPVEEPPNEPGKPPVKEPPPEDPDREPPRKPPVRAAPEIRRGKSRSMRLIRSIFKPRSKDKFRIE
jgi:hypothetical protein